MRFESSRVGASDVKSWTWSRRWTRGGERKRGEMRDETKQGCGTSEGSNGDKRSIDKGRRRRCKASKPEIGRSLSETADGDGDGK